MHIQGTGERVAPPEQQGSLPTNNLREREREGGTPSEQEGEGMATPEQHSTITAQGTRERKGGLPPYPERREEKG